ncbi:MAG: transcriptional repressor LexA [Chloroflexi bacterium]|nr:transcriptional repressor LexA [Chloroflexota bacterium]
MANTPTGSLTDSQQRIMDFINRYVSMNDVPPTIREIQHGAGISSTSMVSYHLKALERANLLNRRERSSRGVMVRDPERVNLRSVLNVPVVGRIVASEPVPMPDADAMRDSENSVQVARSLVNGDEDLYALEVKGNSMIDALISDGDIVVMKRMTEVQNGDLAAVFLTDRNEATLKRVYHEGRRLRLKPENPTMQPFYVDARHVQIQGKVVCVLRKV